MFWTHYMFTQKTLWEKYEPEPHSFVGLVFFFLLDFLENQNKPQKCVCDNVPSPALVSPQHLFMDQWCVCDNVPSPALVFPQHVLMDQWQAVITLRVRLMQHTQQGTLNRIWPRSDFSLIHTQSDSDSHQIWLWFTPDLTSAWFTPDLTEAWFPFVSPVM